MVKSKKHKRKRKEHPFVRGMRELVEANKSLREFVIDVMYDRALDIAEKNEKRLRDYVR